MVNAFNVVYPPKNYLQFDGGKNSKIQRNLILDNETPDCLNVIFDDQSVQTRQGVSLVNTTPVGSFTCDGFYTRHDYSGSEKLFGWWNGTLNGMSGTTFTAVTNATSVFTAATKVYAAEFENHIFFGNGGAGSIPYKLNATTFSRMGIYPPASAPAVVSNSSAGSNLLGVYQYGITFINSNLVESEVSPLSTFTFASTAGSITVPSAPVSWGVYARGLYRTIVSSTVLYKVADIPGNTSTVYVDTKLDAELGDELLTDVSVPPNFGPILYHQSRLFMIGKYPGDDFDRIYYTEIGNPYVVPAANFINVGDNTADIPKTLGLWDNFLVIGGANGTTWLVHMPTTDDAQWTLLRLRATYGSRSHLGQFEALNYLLYPCVERNKYVGYGALSAQGLQASDTATQQGVVGAELISQVIEDEMFNISYAYLENVCAIVYKNRAYITATTGASTVNNRIFVFDFSRANVSRAQKYTWSPWTGLNAAQFAVYNGDLYYASSNPDGFVYKMFQGYSDNGVAIDSYMWTKEIPGNNGHEIWFKDFRFANLLYSLTGAFKMGITIRADSDRGTGLTTDLDCSPGTETWGTMIWGKDKWNAGMDTIDKKIPLANYRGKRIQFKFSNKNVLGAHFKVAGLYFTYNLKGRR